MVFVRKNTGISVIIGGPGDRQVSTDSFDHYIFDYDELVAHTVNGNCIEAVIVNAVSCVRNKEVANRMKIILDHEDICFYKIAQCVRLLHKLKEKLQFKKIRGVEKKLMSTDSWYWVKSLSKGVYIMRLHQPQKRAHCIVVDGNRSLILDSAEHYPMHLCEESLLISTGKPHNKSKVCFVEVYELVEQM